MVAPRFDPHRSLPLLRSRLGWMLVGASLVLHGFTVYCFSQQPDHFTAFTVIPIWLWGGIGLSLSGMAFYYFFARFARFSIGLWIMTLLLGMDEAKSLWHLAIPSPIPGKPLNYEGNPVLRVATLNCAIFAFGNPAEDLAAWQPDIVLLQDAMPHQVRIIADTLFNGRGDFRAHLTNGIVTRWKITREVSHPQRRNQQVTVRLPDAREIEVVNVHLLSAATDLRIGRRTTWRTHRINRALRSDELLLTRSILDESTQHANPPTIFGGDFNAPATDLVHRQLSHRFINSFTAVGTGWGNTYPRRLPVLRIDHLYASPELTPVRSRVVETRHSDHRMVISDFLTLPSPGMGF